MATPITGPFYRERDVPGKYRYSTWYRQAKPYDRALPYILVDKQITTFFEPGHEGPLPSAAGQGSDGPDSDKARARNDAYARFVSNLGSTASVGVSIAEASQSVNMIVSRATAILKGVRALKQGKLGDAASYLAKGQPPRADRRNLRGSKRKQKGRSVGLSNPRREAKDWANNYLEFHFGWSPMLQDIYEACKVLNEDFPASRVFGTGGCRGSKRTNVNQTVTTQAWDIKVRVQARVRVTNPNLLLASKLGLVNPATIAWELVPFSFVVDWFVNVGDYLSSFTDLLGLSLEDPFTTMVQSVDNSSVWIPRPNYIGNLTKSKCYSMSRSKGITGPTIKMKPFKGFSVRRGAAAISLLVQSMKDR